MSNAVSEQKIQTGSSFNTFIAHCEPKESSESSQIDIDPNSFYNPDGTVNFEAVGAFVSKNVALKQNSPAQSTPLEALSPSSISLSITLEELAKERETADTLCEKDPVSYAFGVWIAHSIMQYQEYGLLEPSPHLLHNCRAKLNFANEAGRFFEEMLDSQRMGFEFATNSQEKITGAETDASALRTIVAIPVAGHQEHGNIFNTLSQFAKQDMNSNEFEVVLHLNVPASIEGTEDESLAGQLTMTMNEIERAKREFPWLRVHEIVNTYRLDPPTIGAIRSDLWATIAMNLHKRNRQEDILVVSCDADVVSLSNNYLSEMVRTFEQTRVDFVTASLTWQQIPDLTCDARANRILRYQTFLDQTRDNYGKILHAADANTGLSLAAYMAVGGFDRESELGEMRSVVNRIRYYRQSAKGRVAPDYRPTRKVEAKATKAKLRTNSRRLLKVMSMGYSPYNAWDQNLIKFGSNDELRTVQTSSELAEKAAEEHWKKWVKNMSDAYLDELTTKDKRRLLKGARRILDFTDLYKPNSSDNH